MKTKSKKQLGFNKNTIVELNDNELLNVNGGTTWPCRIIISIIVTTIRGDQGPGGGNDTIFGNGFEMEP